MWAVYMVCDIVKLFMYLHIIVVFLFDMYLIMCYFIFTVLCIVTLY